MYKIGIIGCGKIAQVRHIPEYAGNGKCEITGYYDLNAGRAASLAERFGGKAYESVEALLDSGVDAVSVCTANNTHAEITLKALKAGKHVLCEKPMATTLEDCVKMTEAASSSSGILMIGQNQRFTRTHAKARSLIAGGVVGRPLTFRTIFGHGGPETWSVDPGKNTWFFDKSKAAMGAMADLGIHKTDLIQFLLDDTVSAVSSIVTTLDKKGADGGLIPVDDNAVCIYRMKSGAVGTMTASWTFYGNEDNSTVIYGTEGIMKIYADPSASIIIEHPDGTRELYEVDAIQTNDNQTSSGVIDEFISSIEKGVSAVPAASVLPAMKAVFAALESAETGKTVIIK